MVYDVFEGFSDLDSILYLSSFNKKCSMADIRRGKLGRTATRGFGEVGTVLGTYLGYSTNGDTKGRRDLMTRITRFEHLNDEVNFGSREGFHGSGKEVVVVCLARDKFFM